MSPNSQNLLDSSATNALLEPTGTPGVYAGTGLFERIIEGLSALISGCREPGAQILRFPPVMNRALAEKSGYLKSFPHFLGCVSSLQGDEASIRTLVEDQGSHQDWTDGLAATDLVLTPAACYPLYPLIAARGVVPASGRVFDVYSDCFRREASHETGRLQSFRMREYVCVGAADAVRAFRARWLARAQVLTQQQLELPYELAPASDPFFGRAGKIMAMSQVEQALKFELRVPINSAATPTACMSFNYHQDHFGMAWGLRTDAHEVAHSACVAFGLERLVLALFATHGLDLKTWPVNVRAALGA